MTVYVDNANISYGRMKMSHMWADDPLELLAMADAIGVDRKWLQGPPTASWLHFDVSLGAKAKAIALGAVLTDKYGPAEHVARQAIKSAERKLAMIAAARARRQEPTT